MYADRDDNVFQKDNKGNWNQRDNQNRSWQPAGSNNASVNNMNRESQMRERGNTRTSNFNQQRGGSSPSRSMSRGGGGGGRRR